MVSPSTYANLLQLYRSTVSVAIKELRSSSIFNLDRVAIRSFYFVLHFCSFSPLLPLSFSLSFLPLFFSPPSLSFIFAQRRARCTGFTRKLFCCLEREFCARMREQSRINLASFCASKRVYASRSSVHVVLQLRNYKNTIRADQALLSRVPRWKSERYACEMIYSTVSTQLPVRAVGLA